jgi:uncharacterized glyoxalase superfamily protein PhnB
MAEGEQTSSTPTIFDREPMATLRWLEAALGSETNLLVTDDASAVGHAEMSFMAATLGVGGEWSSPDLLGPAAMKSPASLDGVGTQFVRVHVGAGIEAHCDRARAAGARVTHEPADQFYGARSYRAVDLEGHVWCLDQLVRTLTIEERAKASGLTFAESL